MNRALLDSGHVGILSNEKGDTFVGVVINQNNPTLGRAVLHTDLKGQVREVTRRG